MYATSQVTTFSYPQLRNSALLVAVAVVCPEASIPFSCAIDVGNGRLADGAAEDDLVGREKTLRGSR